MTTESKPTQDQSPAPTTETKDIGELSFSDYQKVRRGQATVESVQPKSAPADKAEHKKSETSDTSEPANEGKDETDESEVEGDEPEAKDSENDKPKKKGGIQRRVDKLNKRVSAAQQEAEYWKEQALKGASGPKEASKVETPKADQTGKPDPDKFETHAEYVEALTDWKLESREKANAAKAEQAKRQTQQETLLKSHYEREKSFAAKTDDYVEVLEDAGSFKDASPALQELIVTSDHGPELMYELAKNKSEYERINNLSPVAAARELGKLEAKFSVTTQESKPETKKTTSAPKPIEPVGSGKGHVAKSISDPNLSFSDYERLRREQMRKRRA